MNQRSFLLVLLICLGLRAITLEYPDLIDPTESRYAFVAQEMFLSGDWVVPKLPWQGVVEPYLGKPPLHFWLTAASFSLFGMDEWVARLSSFLGLLIICGSLLYLKKFDAFREIAPFAALIVVSSALMYFLSGASVVDVTLAACTTVSFTSAFALIDSKEGRLWPTILLFLGVGLGFLTKGPIALVLLGFPAALWVIVTRRYDVLRKPKWIVGVLVFLIVVVPWFALAQNRNPDFLRYFFVNENFGRYLLKDYGDRYGSGHRYPFGTVWGMLIVGFLPWTIPVAIEMWHRKKSLCTLSFWKDNPHLLFAAAWAASPAIIFTFARQLHAAYVLPGVPGLALFSAYMLREAPKIRSALAYSFLSWLMIAVSIGTIIAGFLLGTTEWNIELALIPVAILIVLAIKIRRNGSNEVIFSTITVAAFAVTTLILANNIGERRSTETILRCLTQYSPEAEPSVGIINANSYSLYFYSRAWREELVKPVRISFYRSEKLPTDLPVDIVVRTTELAALRRTLPSDYQVITAVEKWTWLRNAKEQLVIENCPAEI